MIDFNKLQELCLKVANAKKQFDADHTKVIVAIHNKTESEKALNAALLEFNKYIDENPVVPPQMFILKQYGRKYYVNDFILTFKDDVIFEISKVKYTHSHFNARPVTKELGEKVIEFVKKHNLTFELIPVEA